MMCKKINLFALGLSLSVSTTSLHATLSGGELLNFDDGVGDCLLGGTYPGACTYGITTVVSGSYFAMDLSGNGMFEPGERVVIENAGAGFKLGLGQVKGALDNDWGFANNLGRHHTSTGTVPTVNGSGSVDMSGWTVYWGAPGDELDIDMGQGGNATIVCTSGTMTCADGETFTLDYTAVVPSGGFTGVAYQLHLEGTVVVLNGSSAPAAIADSFTVEVGSASNELNVLANDTDPDVDIDIASIVIQSDVSDGSASVNPNGSVTYSNNGATLAPDSFTYTVKDVLGNESAAATVTINIQNAGVFAQDDAALIDTSTQTSIDINVTSNDDDGEAVGLDLSTVLIVQDVMNGSTSLNNGVITYTPTPSYVGSDSFTYTVENLNGTLSNVATVLISVSNASVGVLDPDSYFILDSGTVAVSSVKPPVGDGSWFSMEVVANAPSYTALAGFNHLHLGEIQRASSPGGMPPNPLDPNIDQPWSFFGNIGVSQTTSPVTILTDDGSGNVTLSFVGWDVSWNGIASIPLPNGQDNGVATVTCFTDLATSTQGTCTFGDQFTLDYRAIVPAGDPSGFGNVNYVLHLEGVISATGATIGPVVAPDTDTIQVTDSAGAPLVLQPGTAASTSGNTSGINLSASDVGVVDPKFNPNDGVQCIGGCVDFIINGITTDYIDVVFKLNSPLPQGAIYRKLKAGVWGDFDLSGSDLVGSSPDNGSGVCQSQVFSVGLREGDNCVFLRIYDGGPNDEDGIKNGVVVDPSGALLTGSPNVPPSSTDEDLIGSIGLYQIILLFLIKGVILIRRKRN